MPRIVSVWLPRWPIQRFLAAEARRPSPTPVDPDRPFVLSVDAAGGPHIAALNRAAEAEGLLAGMTLADARARGERLQVRPADPQADDAALKALAQWATRYTPAAAPYGEGDGADGVFLDVAGASHLFGGEAKLIADLRRRLAALGLSSRAAVAATPGAAWALSRFHARPEFVLAAGEEATALAPLPLAALRLSADALLTLRRLGFRRVGDLLDKPRAPFAARFEKELLRRIDQALGRAAEPLAFLAPPPAYRSLRHLMEPIDAAADIVTVAQMLMADLVPALVRDGVGARLLALALYRVDGAVPALEIGVSLPTRDPVHVARLVGLRLEGMVESIDAGFGFEALALTVTAAAPVAARQTELVAAVDAAGRGEPAAALIDGLRQRLGAASVRRLEPVASHLPERAEATAAVAADQPWPAADAARPRPLLLLPKAEAIDVVAAVPDGPPERFRWRGVLHAVAHATGPERIAPEWWRRRAPTLTRDYYVVEDDCGRRFWICREGLFGRETAAPRWRLHGLFP
jgi:protein ImuB